jgi:hypothetical protein
MLLSSLNFLKKRVTLLGLSKAEKQRIELIRNHISQCLKNRRVLNVTLEVEERTEAFREVADDHGLGLGWKLICVVSFVVVVVIFGAYFIVDKRNQQ